MLLSVIVYETLKASVLGLLSYLPSFDGASIRYGVSEIYGVCDGLLKYRSLILRHKNLNNLEHNLTNQSNTVNVRLNNPVAIHTPTLKISENAKTANATIASTSAPMIKCLKDYDFICKDTKY